MDPSNETSTLLAPGAGAIGRAPDWMASMVCGSGRFTHAPAAVSPRVWHGEGRELAGNTVRLQLRHGITRTDYDGGLAALIDHNAR